MFGSKKQPAPTIDRSGAIKMLCDELKEMETVNDGAFMSAYICGAADMAVTLGAITNEERSTFKAAALELERKIASRGKPVYKKKGVYEYNGYHILKDLAKADGDGSSCWCVKKIDGDKMLAVDVTFSEAVELINTVFKG